MAERHLLTLQEAAELVGKSVQTIRRLIKRGDLRGQRVKTPQGFHYLVDEQILRNYYSLKPLVEIEENQDVDPPETYPDVLINQHEIKLVEELQNPILTSQNSGSTSQTQEIEVAEPKNDPEPQAMQSEEIQLLLNHHHEEKMLLYRLLAELQKELAQERNRKSIWTRLFRFLFG